MVASSDSFTLCSFPSPQTGRRAIWTGRGWRRVGGGPHLAQLYVEAMENSVQRRFAASDGGISCINCMSHSTENLYRYKKTSAIRASDDFYPDREYSHTVHIINVVSLGNCICTPAPISSSLILTIRRQFIISSGNLLTGHSKHPSAYLHGAA